MISANDLYQKIRKKYPGFRPPKAQPNDFSVRPKPPLDEEQLELLKAGFPVKPGYDPRFYPGSTMDPEFVDKVIERFSKLAHRPVEP